MFSIFSSLSSSLLTTFHFQMRPRYTESRIAFELSSAATVFLFRSHLICQLFSSAPFFCFHKIFSFQEQFMAFCRGHSFHICWEGAEPHAWRKRQRRLHFFWGSHSLSRQLQPWFLYVMSWSLFSVTFCYSVPTAFSIDFSSSLIASSSSLYFLQFSRQGQILRPLISLTEFHASAASLSSRQIIAFSERQLSFPSSEPPYTRRDFFALQVLIFALLTFQASRLRAWWH